MNRTVIVLLVSVIVLTVVLISGCWSPMNDYWTDVDTETETDTTMVDGGQCLEDDTDNCIDAGI